MTVGRLELLEFAAAVASDGSPPTPQTATVLGLMCGGWRASWLPACISVAVAEGAADELRLVAVGRRGATLASEPCGPRGVDAARAILRLAAAAHAAMAPLATDDACGPATVATDGERV